MKWIAIHLIAYCCNNNIYSTENLFHQKSSSKKIHKCVSHVLGIYSLHRISRVLSYSLSSPWKSAWIQSFSWNNHPVLWCTVHFILSHAAICSGVFLSPLCCVCVKGQNTLWQTDPVENRKYRGKFYNRNDFVAQLSLIIFVYIYSLL